MRKKMISFLATTLTQTNMSYGICYTPADMPKDCGTAGRECIDDLTKAEAERTAKQLVKSGNRKILIDKYDIDGDLTDYWNIEKVGDKIIFYKNSNYEHETIKL